jgi:3-oxoadipate CoA-transferase alpha subunit
LSKIYPTVDDAIFDVSDGASIMFGGFVSAGVPNRLIEALIRRGTTDITVIANNIGVACKLDDLCLNRQVRKAIVSFAIRASSARSSAFEALYHAGEVELELVPQGTLAERIRAGGAGIGGFFTPTGVGSIVEAGKEKRVIDRREHLLELPLRAQFAFIRAYKADTMGNLVYRMAGRNFNPIMATAADCVIAEVDDIVEVGELDPETVGTPATYVDRIVAVGGGDRVDWYP